MNPMPAARIEAEIQNKLSRKPGPPPPARARRVRHKRKSRSSVSKTGIDQASGPFRPRESFEICRKRSLVGQVESLAIANRLEISIDHATKFFPSAC